jgi:ligand-binding SRPBCC domain-containing protein
MTPRYRLERRQFIRSSPDEVFDFFCDVTNLQRSTPAFLHLRVVQPRLEKVHEGMLIDYELRLLGVPLHWRSGIESFEPGVRFVDVQLRGPYREWRHLHEFRGAAEGTEMLDRVDYSIPCGPIGSLAHAAFVRRTLGRIFDFRRDVIEQIFNRRGAPTPCQ